jgi:hypothetical protein
VRAERTRLALKIQYSISKVDPAYVAPVPVSSATLPLSSVAPFAGTVYSASAYVGRPTSATHSATALVQRNHAIYTTVNGTYATANGAYATPPADPIYLPCIEALRTPPAPPFVPTPAAPAPVAAVALPCSSPSAAASSPTASFIPFVSLVAPAAVAIPLS